jgi:hypothetical protein
VAQAAEGDLEHAGPGREGQYPERSVAGALPAWRAGILQGLSQIGWRSGERRVGDLGWAVYLELWNLER